MTPQEREKVIEFIIANDRSFDYRYTNFNYYKDEDLMTIKRWIDWEMRTSTGNITLQGI